jgi:phosphoglycerol transferase MdoB-like AlkP superfamily enzyme
MGRHHISGPDDSNDQVASAVSITPVMRMVTMHGTAVAMLGAMSLLYFLWFTDFLGTNLLVLPKSSPTWLWVETLLFMLLLCRHWLMGLLIWGVAAVALLLANALKIQMLQFPITEQDFVMIASNLPDILYAVGLSYHQQVAALSVVVAAAAIAVYRLARRLERLGASSGGSVMLSHGVPQVSLLTLAIAILVHFYGDYGAYLYENRSKYVPRGAFFRHSDMRDVSLNITALGFLAYSHVNVERDLAALVSPMDKYRDATSNGRPSLDADAWAKSIRKYSITMPSDLAKPNIVFILAESTFDPNVAFRLTRPVTSPLLDTQADGLHGTVHVTAVGGGTHVTEFETITGVDMRLLGLRGYPHNVIASYMKRSIAQYLNERGYTTRAFYPLHGSAFGAYSGYRQYGFQSFTESLANWGGSDERIAEVIVGDPANVGGAPFFWYVVLIENHSPHACRNFAEEEQLATAFRREKDFGVNCSLNEYIRRLRSTEMAYEKLVQRMREIESQSGRPYIVILFGDHQPADFLSRAYNEYRTAAPPTLTVLKMDSSARVQMPMFTKPPHITVLPTVVSTAVASNTDDIYLPENLYVYDQCGYMPDPTKCAQIGTLGEAYRQYLKAP